MRMKHQGYLAGEEQNYSFWFRDQIYSVGLDM